MIFLRKTIEMSRTMVGALIFWAREKRAAGRQPIKAAAPSSPLVRHCGGRTEAISSVKVDNDVVAQAVRVGLTRENRVRRFLQAARMRTVRVLNALCALVGLAAPEKDALQGDALQGDAFRGAGPQEDGRRESDRPGSAILSPKLVFLVRAPWRARARASCRSTAGGGRRAFEDVL